MAKFLDKKERVIDLKLTSYGRFLFAVGKFKPYYYTGIISNYTQPMGIQKPRFDNFRYDNAIGDSLFDGRKENLVPSWKVISLNSNISSSSQKLTDTTITELNIPQVNLTVNYKKVIKSYDSIL